MRHDWQVLFVVFALSWAVVANGEGNPFYDKSYAIVIGIEAFDLDGVLAWALIARRPSE